MKRRGAGWFAVMGCAVLLLAALSPPGAALSGTGTGTLDEASAAAEAEPGLRIVPADYSLEFMAQTWSEFYADHRRSWSLLRPNFAPPYIGEIEVTGRPYLVDDLKFAVEGAEDAEAASWQNCKRVEVWGYCDDIGVRVHESLGLLYLVTREGPRGNGSLWTSEFSDRRVELSAEHDDSNFKVYREVNITPATGAHSATAASQTAEDSAPLDPLTACRDYPAMDRDRYACLYLAERMPASMEVPAATDEMREGLPDLVQPASQYELVFAEEFDGADAPSECGYSMAALSEDIWTYDDDPCDNLDRLGEACEYVADGQYKMSFAQNSLPFVADCDAAITTRGKFEYKYGYLEVQQTFRLDGYWGWHNMAMTLGVTVSDKSQHFDQYGITVSTPEDFLVNEAVEINIFEFTPVVNLTHRHQYLNWSRRFNAEGVVPTYTDMKTKLCGTGTNAHLLPIVDADWCEGYPRTVTITRGLEWTPQGYRWFLKVHGVHDELFVLPEENIAIQQRIKEYDDEGNFVEFGRPQPVTGSDKDRFFEYLVPGDTDSLLSQVAVSHVPQYLTARTYGDGRAPEIQSWVSFDYIRVFQPSDLYASMEPVYQ